MSGFNILLYFAVALIIIGYLFLKKKFSFFEENGIPHIKPTSLILGNMDGVGKTINFGDFMLNLYKKTKGKDVIAGYYTFFLPKIVITDLELAKQILVKDFNNFTDRGIYVNEEKEPLTGNLFNVGGEKWRFLRNKLSPVFTSGKIKMMYQTISNKGDSFVKAIENASKSGSVEIKEMSNRFTIDIVSSTAFGMETNTLNYEHQEFVDLFQKVFIGAEASTLMVSIAFLYPKLMKILSILNFRMFDKEISEFFSRVIKSSISYREANDVKHNDFLNMVIQLKNKGSIDGEFSSDNRKLTLNECIAQSWVFFVAGADTSSTTIAFAMTELGLNPEVQEKVRAEVMENIKDDNGEITYNNLLEMTYLNQVMNETLRKYPPAAFSIREAHNDYKIPNSKHVIQKGSQVIIPNMGFHYDDRYWKKPQEFNPDRFSPEEIVKRPNFSFIPFGEGQRICIGMRFAQVNVKFAIATLIKNFRVTVDKTKTTVPLKLDSKLPAIAAEGGFWLKVKKV